MKIRHLMGLCHPVATYSYRHRYTCVPPVALHTTTRCNTLQYTTTHSATHMHATVGFTHCNTLQHAATHNARHLHATSSFSHCSTRQHATTRCDTNCNTVACPQWRHTLQNGNTLQHSATHTATDLHATSGFFHSLRIRLKICACIPDHFWFVVTLRA